MEFSFNGNKAFKVLDNLFKTHFKKNMMIYNYSLRYLQFKQKTCIAYIGAYDFLGIN